MPADFPLGRIVWHELMTTDTPAAIDFYQAVVGWDTMNWGQDPGYRLWTNGDTPVGGLMILPVEARQMGAPPHWLMYVGVPDCGATIDQASGLGAQVLVPPQTIPTVGTFAVLSDPQAAVFAVLQPEGDVPGHDGEPKRGEFSWHELATTDWEAAWAFYSRLFGWETTEDMDMGPMGVYHMFGRNGQSMGGMFNKPPEMPQPPNWLCYAKVKNVDHATEKITLRGGTVVNAPMDVPGGDRIVQCLDPQGVAFALHSVAPKQAKRAKPAKRAKSKSAKASRATGRKTAKTRRSKRAAKTVRKKRR